MNLRPMPRKMLVLGHFFGFVWPFLRSKTSLFLAEKEANPFVFNKSLSLFPLF
jgi:hypothetical protein